MKGDEQMKTYIKEYDSVLIEKTESKTNYDFEISEKFNQNIKMMCDKEKSYNTSSKQISMTKYRGLVAALAVIFLMATTIGVNAATDGKILELMKTFWGAQIVNDENKTLIGKETIADINDVGIIKPEEPKENIESGNKEYILEDSHIVRSIDSEMVEPLSIDEFQVVDGMTPELIMTNGAAVIFYQDDYEGWKCDIGDRLIFDFSKYESEVMEEQALVLGYVLDGVMYNSKEVFRKVNGRYELLIENAGEYYIYAISATSDYLTLRKGEIKLEK